MRILDVLGSAAECPLRSVALGTDRSRAKRVEALVGS